ncbi:MAG: T9SS type A sorting domain-containing protein, partial [Cytophagaceae bacterium]|nr:T9SS type A sorting domain-containing protein [Cytophagaceae bacterium]
LLIESTLELPVHIRIRDLSGRILHDKPEGFSNKPVSLGSELAQGTYLVEILFANRTYYKRIIKSH